MSLGIYKGLWQIPLREDSQEIFMIIYLEGLWKPRRMPQGYSNATTHFMGVMNHDLVPLLGEICAVYVDDIINFAQSGQESVQRVRIVL